MGVCSWSLHPETPQELLERLDAVGIRCVQLALSPLIDAPSRWGNVIELLNQSSFRIVSGMMSMRGEDYSTLESIARSGGVRPDPTWSANRDHARAVAALAGAAGIELVTFHAGFIPEERDEPERAKVLDRLQTVAGIFQDRGVEIALETGQETADTLREALRDLQAPVGVNFDPANMILYGKGDPVQAIHRLRDHVRQVHIKDAVASHHPGEWGREVAAGEGSVDWKALFEMAESIHPPVNYVIEREAGEERQKDMVAARRLVEGLMKGDRVPRNQAS